MRDGTGCERSGLCGCIDARRWLSSTHARPVACTAAQRPSPSSGSLGQQQLAAARKRRVRVGLTVGLFRRRVSLGDACLPKARATLSLYPSSSRFSSKLERAARLAAVLVLRWQSAALVRPLVYRCVLYELLSQHRRRHGCCRRCASAREPAKQAYEWSLVVAMNEPTALIWRTGRARRCLP